jgi:hypothetical protein
VKVKHKWGVDVSVIISTIFFDVVRYRFNFGTGPSSFHEQGHALILDGFCVPTLPKAPFPTHSSQDIGGLRQWDLTFVTLAVSSAVHHFWGVSFQIIA